ncbi:hypothetical protein SprV_0602124200 [Sparganum proliferum]
MHQFHDAMIELLTVDRTVSKAFAVTNGVKKSCAPIPNLFSLMFSAMLMAAYLDERPEIRIAYRIDGHLLNGLRVQTPTHLSMTIIHHLLSADDYALNTATKPNL